ncbi:MAG: hypothetical protein WA174_14715 [Rhodoferax sp.]
MNILEEKTIIIVGGITLVAVLAAWAVKKATGVAGGVANAVNPLNHDNVFAGTVNQVGNILVTDPTGPGKNADGSWSLGGWVYDVTHPATADAVKHTTDTITPAYTIPPNFGVNDPAAGW